MEEASSAYGAEMWHELYVMVGGAAGALAGLLFVAVSINLDRIIGQKYLPRRAAETLAGLRWGCPQRMGTAHRDSAPAMG